MEESKQKKDYGNMNEHFIKWLKKQEYVWVGYENEWIISSVVYNLYPYAKRIKTRNWGKIINK